LIHIGIICLWITLEIARKMAGYFRYFSSLLRDKRVKR
jgi:hypothetical protein